MLLERGEPYKVKKWKWIRYKYHIISLLDRFPLLKRQLVHARDRVIILKYKWESKKIAKVYGDDFDIDKTYWIEPERIKYASLKEFDLYKYKGKISGGDWDRLEKKFEDLDVYIAFKERFIEGKSWENSIFYQRVLDRINKGQFLWGCRNKSEWDRRCKSLDLLYQNIKNEGFKSQRDILLDIKKKNPLQAEDEITVNVGCNGDLLFNDAAHRLSIAKLLGIQKIPIKITVRHPQWQNFRKEILLYAKEHGGKIYHPITHPDLCDIPAFHSDKRFRIIKDNLSVRKGRLLDIGANWGYFCHKFEKMGFDCYAVERGRVNVYFLKKLKRAEGRSFKIIPNSIFEYRDIENLHFDVVLALNIFHHFLKKKDSYLKFLDLLKNLKMKEMYFQPPLPNEPQMEGANKNYSEEEFVEFILQNSKLNRAKLIGNDQDGRSIYKLYANNR